MDPWGGAETEARQQSRGGGRWTDFGTLWFGRLLGTLPLHHTNAPCGRPNLLIQDVRVPCVGPFVFQGSFFGHMGVEVLGDLLRRQLSLVGFSWV